MVTETCKAIHPLHPQAIPIMVEEDACVEVDVLYAHVQPTKRRGSNWNDLQADVLSLIFGHLPDRERCCSLSLFLLLLALPHANCCSKQWRSAQAFAEPTEPSLTTSPQCDSTRSEEVP